MRYEKVLQLDKKINQKITSKANYDKYTQPVCAFITFETDNARQEALKYTE